MRKNNCTRLHMLGAAAALALSLGASTALADPLVTLKILGSPSLAGPYVGNLSVAPGQTVYYELVGQIATAGTTNSQSSFTVAAAQNSTDGIGGLNSINLADAANQLTVLGTLQNGFDQGTGHSAGAASGGSINGIIALLGTGVNDVGAASPVVIDSGTFTAATFSTDTISGSGPSTFNAKVNTTGGDKNLVNKANGASDPYVGIVPLALTEVPEPATLSFFVAFGGTLLIRRVPPASFKHFSSTS